jgi:hypothetical protein
VNLAAGSNLIVYAVGSLADETFTFYTQEIEVGMEAAAGAMKATPKRATAPPPRPPSTPARRSSTVPASPCWQLPAPWCSWPVVR